MGSGWRRVGTTAASAMANPACRPVNIVAGASVFAGWFTNYEKQVISQ